MAASKIDGIPFGDIEETIDGAEVVAEGRVFRYERLSVTLPDGSHSKRDVVRLPGGSVIVPIDDEGYVYLVSQYRAAIGRVTIELPAGRLEPGEKPEDCAARELLEETGLKAGSLKLLTSMNPTPGYSDEVLHIFLATELESDTPKPDAGEFLNVMFYPLDEAVDLVADGDIADAKTVIGILLAERRLRLGHD